MPRGTAFLILLASFLFVLSGCAGAPSPTPEATRRPTRTPIPPATLKPLATRVIASATPLSTETLTASPSPSVSPQAAQTAPPQKASAPANIPASNLRVWTLAPLVDYFLKLGPSNQDPIARPANVDPLTGLEVSDPSFLQRRPVLARVGNDPAARAIHAGFNQADLVFEEMIDQIRMNFAITRFTLVFYGQTGSFRPVRSARVINAALMPMFDGILMSSGASNGTRNTFVRMPWKDLYIDGDFNNGALCVDGTASATHVVSNVERVHEYIARRVPEKPVTLRGFQFSPNPPGGSPVTSLTFDHGPWPYRAAGVTQWRFDPGSGKFLRFVNGAPHNTLQYALTGKWGGQCQFGAATTEQISASNVVVLNVLYEPTDFPEDKIPSYSAFIELTGSGDAQIYRDGVLVNARWERPTLTSFIKLVDASGNEIPLKPGNTWFELGSPGYKPTVK